MCDLPAAYGTAAVWRAGTAAAYGTARAGWRAGTGAVAALHYLRACTALTDSQILSGTRIGMHNFLKKRSHSFFYL
jgi:hypothetical protein